MIIAADIYEPIDAVVTADSTAFTADATYPTADGGLLEGASDFTDATRIAAAGAFWVDRIRRPRRVVGVGFGILPELVGEAHGTVYIAGEAAATLSIAVAAVGEVDDGIDELIVMLLLAA